MADSSHRLLREAWQAARLRRAFQPVVPSQRLDLEAVVAVWRAIGEAAAAKLRDGRGTVLPRFGAFVLLHGGAGGQSGGLRTPALQLNREFVRSTALVPAAPDAPPRAIASTSSAISFATLSRQCGVPKDMVHAVVKEISLALGAAASDNSSGVWLSLPPLGSFHCAGGKASFVFSQEFCAQAKLRQPAVKLGQSIPPPSSLREPAAAAAAAAAVVAEVDQQGQMFRGGRSGPHADASSAQRRSSVGRHKRNDRAPEIDGSSSGSSGSPDMGESFELKEPPPSPKRRAADRRSQVPARLPRSLAPDDRAVVARQPRAPRSVAVSSRGTSGYSTGITSGAGGAGRSGVLTVEQVSLVRRLCRLLDVFCALDGSGRGVLKEFDLTTGLPSALGVNLPPPTIRALLSYLNSGAWKQVLFCVLYCVALAHLSCEESVSNAILPRYCQVQAARET